MDATRLAAGLLEPIPANKLFRLEVVRAAEARAEVCLRVTPEMTNVIGSLHSSGLIALVDATGLAAVIAAAGEERQFDGVTPLGSVAHLQFLAPATGRLRGHCELDGKDVATLQALFERRADKAQVDTAVEIVDEEATVVCRGRFTWKLRRSPGFST